MNYIPHTQVPWGIVWWVVVLCQRIWWVFSPSKDWKGLAARSPWSMVETVTSPLPCSFASGVQQSRPLCSPFPAIPGSSEFRKFWSTFPPTFRLFSIPYALFNFVKLFNNIVAELDKFQFKYRIPSFQSNIADIFYK